MYTQKGKEKTIHDLHNILVQEMSDPIINIDHEKYNTTLERIEKNYKRGLLTFTETIKCMIEL